MCLDTIAKKIYTPSQKIRQGYKGFTLSRRGNLLFPIMGGVVTPGKWMEAKEETLASPGVSYTSGFHINKSKSRVRWGRVTVLVKFKEAHITGTQDKSIVLVARYMMVPKSEFTKFQRWHKDWCERMEGKRKHNLNFFEQVNLHNERYVTTT